MNRNRGLFGIIAVIVVAILLIGLIMWILGRNDQEATDQANNQETAVVEDDEESTLTKILDDPAAYVGQEVTVSAEVQDVLTNRIFKISNDVAGDELTVLTAQQLSDQQAAQAEELLLDNANVQISGTVRQATVTEIERDYDIVLDSELEVEFDDTIVLVAESITFIDHSDEVWRLESEGQTAE